MDLTEQADRGAPPRREALAVNFDAVSQRQGGGGDFVNDDQLARGGRVTAKGEQKPPK
jgi:hypothetical protein